VITESGRIENTVQSAMCIYVEFTRVRLAGAGLTQGSKSCVVALSKPADCTDKQAFGPRAASSACRGAVKETAGLNLLDRFQPLVSGTPLPPKGHCQLTTARLRATCCE
jgi:hypothetical protein